MKNTSKQLLCMQLSLVVTIVSNVGCMQSGRDAPGGQPDSGNTSTDNEDSDDTDGDTNADSATSTDNDAGTAGDTDTDGDTDTETTDTSSDTDDDTSTSPDGGSDTDTATESDTTANMGRYLVSIDHSVKPNRLLKIDVGTGLGVEVCMLPLEYSFAYNTCTFSRAGDLYAHDHSDGNAKIYIINPCDCQVTYVGQTGYADVPGITVNYGPGLFGVEIQSDVLLDIDPGTAVGAEVGQLGVDFGWSGATWSDSLNGLYAINSSDDSLYTIDSTTGAATLQVEITGASFGVVGIELNPYTGIIYACTGDAILYAIDPVSGVATAIGDGMGHGGLCNNLAAPWTFISCLEQI